MRLIQNDDLIQSRTALILVLCNAARTSCVYATQPTRNGCRRFNRLKSLEIEHRPTFLAGVLDAITDALRALAQAVHRAWRHPMRGVTANIARAESMNAALDRWLWKQRQRETEDWLGQSKDRFLLEARIRELERRPASRIC